MTHPRTTNPTRRLLAVAVAATVLATGACSAGSDKRADTKSSAGSTSKPASGATTTRPADGGGTKTRPASDEKGGEVLGTTTGQRPASTGASYPVPLRLDVTSVKRLSGDTVEVRFDLTNTGEEDDYEPYRSLSDGTSPGGAAYDTGGVALLDRPNDKKYLALYDTNDQCLCSDVGDLMLKPGKTVSLYADVTSPPSSTTSVDMTMPGFDPITGLEIQ